MRVFSEIPDKFRLYATCDHCLRPMVQVDLQDAIRRYGDLELTTFRNRLRCTCGQRGAIRIVYHGDARFAHTG